MSCKIYLIRHGQSLGNSRNVFLGHTDLDLSELGYRQAASTAQYLKNFNIDTVYSSDLKRAYSTCNEYLKLSGKTAEKTADLREIYAGEWENQTFDYLEEHFRESYGVWLHDLGHAEPDGGETVAGLEKRVVACLTKIAQENDGKTVAVFTHATVIRAFCNYAYGHPLSAIKNLKWATNASVSSVEYNDGAFNVIEYSTDSFLNDLITGFPANV